MTEILKPCPFCGGEARISKMGYPHWIYCESCGAKVHGRVVGEVEGEKASIEAWNRRAEYEPYWKPSEFCNAVLNASYLLATTPQEIVLALQYIEPYFDTNNDNFYKIISMAGIIFDETRQSGDDVGHTLRTIFHMVRIQKVKDCLKSFNIKTDKFHNKNCLVNSVIAICDSIGRQWEHLDNAQKLTVAKTLGGTRCMVALLNLFEEYHKVVEVCEKLSDLRYGELIK